MIVNISRVLIIIAFGFIILLFMVHVLSLKFNLSPHQIEYNETKEFLSNLSYRTGEISSNCFYYDIIKDRCHFSNTLVYPNYLNIDSNINCSLYVNNTYFSPYIQIEGLYNTTHNYIECKYYLSPYSTYCNETNSYTFIFKFNATPLPRRQDTNIVLLNNLSYYDGSTYRTCNISYNYTFMPAPLEMLTFSYLPLNSSRTLDKTNLIAYAYLNDYFILRLNASNIRDNNYSGKLKYAWLNLTNNTLTKLTFLNASKNAYLGNISSGSYKIKDFLFRASSLGTESIHFNFSDYTGYYWDDINIKFYVMNLSIRNVEITKNILRIGENFNVNFLVVNNASKIENISVELTNIDTNEKIYLNFSKIDPITYISITSPFSDEEQVYYSLPINVINNSGKYNVSVIVYAGRFLRNKTYIGSYSQSFDLLVLPGTPKVESIQPKYYIMQNQTFIFNYSLQSLNGDLYYVNVSIFSKELNYSRTNFYFNNLSNGTIRYLTGYVYAPANEMPARTIINITYYNLTSNITKTFEFLHRVIYPKALLPNNSYVGNSTSIKVLIAGIYDATPQNVLNFTLIC